MSCPYPVVRAIENRYEKGGIKPRFGMTGG